MHLNLQLIWALLFFFVFSVVFVVVVVMFIIIHNCSETIRPILSIEQYINTSLLLLLKQLIYIIIVTCIHSTLTCSGIQVYDIMVEYNNTHITQTM